MKLTNVKGIIWDLDGTLLDSFTIFEEVLKDIVEERGMIMPTSEQIMHNYHGSLEDSLKSILNIDSASDIEEIVNTFLEKQGKRYTGDLNSHLFVDAADLARAAGKKKVDQVLVTNRAHGGRGYASPKHIIASTFLSECISEVRAGDEVEFNKPDKRALGDWLVRHNLDPDSVVVIGDQAVDAELATNLGVRSIIIKRSGDIPHLPEDVHHSVILVDDLTEIELV